MAKRQPVRHHRPRHHACRFPRAVDSAFERARVMSQAEYDALSPPEPATLYLIVG
ncbi:phage upper tail fiber protein [Mesorhizobium sp. 113-3-3]|uniref:phage upper tail fiber protein n=1 Tax=Mesorhizobium sp. 113-3-3 TaxID=2744516 RepID=UPI00406D29C4